MGTSFNSPGQKTGAINPRSTGVAFKRAVGWGEGITGELGQGSCALPLQPKGCTKKGKLIGRIKVGK